MFGLSFLMLAFSLSPSTGFVGNGLRAGLAGAFCFHAVEA